MKEARLLPRLEAWAQEELGAQQALLRALEAHERSLGRGTPEEIETTVRAIGEVDPRGSARRGELDAILRELAAAWKLASGTLTLGSVAERFEERGARLARLRTELRRAVVEVRERSRRVALVSRQQCAIVSKVLETVLGKDGLEGIRGAVVDSRA
ncbi:MAG: hypothetical protein R3F34_04945 [Planctomycetota bacterium]